MKDLMSNVLGISFETYRSFRRALRHRLKILREEYFDVINPQLDYSEYVQKQDSIKQELLQYYFGDDYNTNLNEVTITILTDVEVDL